MPWQRSSFPTEGPKNGFGEDCGSARQACRRQRQGSKKHDTASLSHVKAAGRAVATVGLVRTRCSFASDLVL